MTSGFDDIIRVDEYGFPGLDAKEVVAMVVDIHAVRTKSGGRPHKAICVVLETVKGESSCLNGRLRLYLHSTVRTFSVMPDKLIGYKIRYRYDEEPSPEYLPSLHRLREDFG